MRTIAEVTAELGVLPDKGLSPESRDKSQARFGRNLLTPLPRQPIWEKFLEKFDEPIIKILLAAALLSLLVDLFKANPNLGGAGLGFLIAIIAGALVAKKSNWLPALLCVSAFVLFVLGLTVGHVLVEGLAVMIAVVLATGVSFLSEYKSDREFELLNARRDSLQSKVLRQGQVQTVPLEDVLVGDVVLLEMGDEIPADGRVLHASELHIDQSLMTGESEAIVKLICQPDEAAAGPEEPGCLYRGTQVVEGVGRLLVTEVGDATYLGQIAGRLGAAGASDQERVKRKLTIAKDLTPLQQKLENLAGLISKVGYIAAVLIFFAQLLRGFYIHEIYWPLSWNDFLIVFGELLGYFVTMVIIIVVAVPEGLPMSVTVSLALAMRKMTRANCLVRQLVACETIGSATVICTDKTGTLTQNKMRVDGISWNDHYHGRTDPGFRLPESAASFTPPQSALAWLALDAAVNSSAHLENKDSQLVTVGNSTEGALLHWLRENAVDFEVLRGRFEPLYRVHFSSERKRMTTVVRVGDRLAALVKGAPEFLLEHSLFYLDDAGVRRSLSPEAKARIQELMHAVSARAMRTLAFAYAFVSSDIPANECDLHAQRDDLENDLVYLGFVAIRDPLRDDVKEAMAECRQAGIDVKMITGDNVDTARAIGHEIGLITDIDSAIDVAGAPVLTSKRFNELDDEALKLELPRLRILARARPLDKFRMVRLLQEMGEVVAVTGDGTNDAPALKKADVGLAMGIAGTEVSKEASKMVLLDDAFSTILKGVHWGRALYENIQKFLQFQLTINVSALTITLLGILVFQVKAPFTVLQLLWINVIMDTLASIALCSEPPRRGLMKERPRRRDENILTPAMMRNILMTGAFFVVVMLGLLVAMKGSPDSPGLFAGPGPWSVEVAGTRLTVPADDLRLEQGRSGRWSFDGHEATVDFTVQQVTLFFTIFVFFQVWNQVNCRSLSAEASGLSGILSNPTFLAIAALVAVGQVLIVTFGAGVFDVEPLPWEVWASVAAFTSSVLIAMEFSRWMRRRLRATSQPLSLLSAPGKEYND